MSATYNKNLSSEICFKNLLKTNSCNWNEITIMILVITLEVVLISVATMIYTRTVIKRKSKANQGKKIEFDLEEFLFFFILSIYY